MEGVATSDLRSGATPELDKALSYDGAITALRWPAGAACIDRWLELLDPQSLRQAGWQVDLRSVLLSPSWRSDDASLRQLGQRPAGPADLTCLRLRDQARIAMQYGIASANHLDALKRMAGLIAKAEECLEEPGVELRCMLLSYAPLVPTQRSFDASAYLLARLSRRQRREIEVSQSPGALQIRAQSLPALETVEELLLREPAASKLQALSPAEAKSNGIALLPCQQVFLPKNDIALSKGPLRAAPTVISARGRNAFALSSWSSQCESPGRESQGRVSELIATLQADMLLPTDHSGKVETSERQVLDPIASYPDLECLFADMAISQ